METSCNGFKFLLKCLLFDDNFKIYEFMLTIYTLFILSLGIINIMKLKH